MDPVRTCVGCRRRAPASSLVRFVARDGVVVVDLSAALPGRGAWLHPSVECADRSLKRRAFGRALKVAGSLDTSGLTEAVLALHQSEPPMGFPNETAERTVTHNA